MKKIIIASGPVIVENKKVLLDKHGDDNFWKFCGGKIEDFENDLMENAKKRAKEELGIDIKITDSEPFIMHLKKNGIDIVLVHYLAKRIGKIKPGADIKEWKWIPLECLEKENLGPNIEPVLIHFWFLDK